MLRCGEDQLAADMLHEIGWLTRRTSLRYRDAANVATRGRVALLDGDDPKEVMDELFTPAKLDSPDEIEPRVAIAELALDKHDYGLAADELRAALELEPDAPELHYLFVRARSRRATGKERRRLSRVLSSSTRRTSGRCCLVDQRIGAELYAGAHGLIEQILAVDWDRWRPGLSRGPRAPRRRLERVRRSVVPPRSRAGRPIPVSITSSDASSRRSIASPRAPSTSAAHSSSTRIIGPRASSSRRTCLRLGQ